MKPSQLANLRPAKTKARAREVGRLGGLANKNNPNTKIGATLREWQKKLQRSELTDQQKKDVLELMHDGPTARFKLSQWLVKIMNGAKTPKEQLLAAQTILSLIEHQHGKAAVRNENVNVNVDVLRVEYEAYNRVVLRVLRDRAPELIPVIIEDFRKELPSGGDS